MSSVLVFVFGGHQPAQVNPRLMPNLSAFAAGGVIFANHHSVFPTVTRVDVSSMVTGLNPGGHGLAGNRLVIREFDPDQNMGALESVLSLWGAGAAGADAGRGPRPGWERIRGHRRREPPAMPTSIIRTPKIRAEQPFTRPSPCPGTCMSRSSTGSARGRTKRRPTRRDGPRHAHHDRICAP